MQSLNKNPKFKFDIGEEDDVPGINDLFQKAAKDYKSNLSFWKSIIAALFKATIAKEQYDSNAAMEEKVINFS
eukprot:11897664-Ditylum_brightwellii.AAC.1